MAVTNQPKVEPAAVNIVIFGGIERGYEASIGEVFNERPFVGVLAALAFMICTAGGVVFVHQQRVGRRNN